MACELGPHAQPNLTATTGIVSVKRPDKSQRSPPKTRLFELVFARAPLPTSNPLVRGAIEHVRDTCPLRPRHLLQGRLAGRGHAPTVDIRLHALQCSASSTTDANPMERRFRWSSSTSMRCDTTTPPLFLFITMSFASSRRARIEALRRLRRGSMRGKLPAQTCGSPRACRYRIGHG
jgi:hypothetical protein